MRTRAGSRSILAGGLLALSLVVVPGAMAAGPSADDPAATVNALLDTLIAKDFEAIGGFACAEKRAEVTQQFDLEATFASLGEGVDVAALFAGLTVTTPDRVVGVAANDGTTATVSVSGSIAVDVDEAVAREFVRQLMEAQGQPVTAELLDQYTPLFLGQVERSQDLAQDLVVVKEDGVWLLCDDFGGGNAASPEPSPIPGATIAPMDPAAYAALLAAIPEPLRDSCTPDELWQSADLGNAPGEIAAADCDPDGYAGNYVSYALFDSVEAMDAFYDQQLQGMKNLGATDGPGCPEGPGEATWEHGRRFCYQPFGSDVYMRWTHDGLAITANAINDGDWAALEAFFASAGPVAP
jgi:hypothetical protein